METPRLHGFLDELAKIGGVSNFVLRKLLTNPAALYGRTERMSQGVREHEETLRALDPRNPYPAGWVALGMKPRPK